MKTHWTAKLRRLGACEEAVAWAQNYTSLGLAWKACERGDWMLWLLDRFSESQEQHQQIVLAACQCARLSLRFVPPDEKRPLRAIEAAEEAAEHKRCADIVRKYFPLPPEL